MATPQVHFCMHIWPECMKGWCIQKPPRFKTLSSLRFVGSFSPAGATVFTNQAKIERGEAHNRCASHMLNLALIGEEEGVGTGAPQKFLKSGKIALASVVMCSFMPDFRLIGITRKSGMKSGTPHHTIHFLYAKFGPISEGAPKIQNVAKFAFYCFAGVT